MEGFVLDKAKFSKKYSVQALKIPMSKCGSYSMKLSKHLLNKPSISNITKEPGQLDFKTRLLLLSDTYKADTIPQELKNVLAQDAEIKLTSYDIVVSYDSVDYAQIMQEILPKGSIVPNPFETIGTIAIFKIPTELIKYKQTIAQIYIDKHTNYTAVVNREGGKKEIIHSKENSLITQHVYLINKVCNSLKLKIDYEHFDLMTSFDEEREKAMEHINMDYTVFNVQPNIGEFALLAAKKGCNVVLYGTKLEIEAVNANLALNSISPSKFTNLIAGSPIPDEIIEKIKFIYISELVNSFESAEKLIKQIRDYFIRNHVKPYSAVKIQLYLTKNEQLTNQKLKEMIECELTKLKVGVPSDKEILYMNSKKCSYADVYTHTVCIKISKHMMFGDSEVKEAIPSIQTTNMSQKLDELDRERYATFNNSLQAFEDTIEVGSKRDLPEKDSSDGIKKKKI